MVYNVEFSRVQVRRAQSIESTKQNMLTDVMDKYRNIMISIQQLYCLMIFAGHHDSL